MRINRVKIHNYRNIDGIEVLLNPECNYIIGENNLGKSNFLTMLSTICGCYSDIGITRIMPKKQLFRSNWRKSNETRISLQNFGITQSAYNGQTD